MTSFRMRIIAQVLPFLLLTPGLALAQAQPSRAEATAAAKPAASYTQQQIDQMVAPIALYPDQLLTQVLMAATYPTQIAEAAQWLQDPANAALKGDQLVAALQPLAWDPSVKALVAFPQVIVMLNDHIEWTQTLGVAFATQQTEVMARVQVLRQLAVKSGRVKQLRHLVVREEGPAIVIAPAEPNVVFVPVYNPLVVYGRWIEPAYPPVFLAPPPSFALETIEPGIQISAGFGIVAPLWGWSRPDWRDHRITINRVEYTRITQNVVLAPGDSWRHNGPVVVVEPSAASRTHAATAVPAGTVAPSKAAAVTSLPKRAASQPNLIQTQKAGSQPSTAKPAEAQTTPAKPGTTQPGQARTTPEKPGTAKPSEAQTTPAKPGETQPGQARTTTEKPGTAKPSEAQTAPAKPGETQPGQARVAPEKPGTAKPGEARTTPAKPGETQPGQARVTPEKPGAAHPGEARSTPERGEKQPGQARTTPEKPGATHPGENRAVATPGETTQPRSAQAPASQPEKAPGAAAGSAASQSREHAPAPSASNPVEPGAKKPAREQAGTKPPAGTPAPGAAATEGRTLQKPGKEPVGEGSTTPPGKATPGGRSEEPDKSR